jgi:predicted PurR-regulated permease PerM
VTGGGVPSPLGMPAEGDRRHLERRTELRLAELTLPEVRRIVVTTALFAGVTMLFVWMVRDVLVAGLLGAVAAAYLRPLYRQVQGAVRRPAASAIATLTLVLVPAAAALAYCYVELLGVATYVQGHQEEVAARLVEGVQALGLGGLVGPAAELPEAARRWALAAAAYGAAFPGAVRAAAARGVVAATILLFTVVYILADAPRIVTYLRGMVSPRYAALVGALERNLRGVLAGAVYGAVLTQAIKAGVVLALTLAFRVPLAGVLALVGFVLGFFPVFGSWSVYVPVAGWLFVFRNAPAQALVVLLVGFFVNTLFVSMYLRPKLAAERSRVLNFYWMFVGLVTGVYALGLPGVVLGPALIAVLKAVVDAVVAPAAWPAEEPDLEHPDLAGGGAPA